MHRHRRCTATLVTRFLIYILVSLSISEQAHAEAGLSLDGQHNSHVEGKPNEHSECQCQRQQVLFQLRNLRRETSCGMHPVLRVMGGTGTSRLALPGQ